MKTIVFFCCFFAASSLHAQELFAYTEPASNMPVKSFAVRSNNYLLRNAAGDYSYMAAPEIMVGISKKVMLHAEAFFGNDPGNFHFDGASIYGKYRFYSKDEVHAHFRMAAYARVAFSNNIMMQPAIDLSGKNSGTELGVTATKLMNKSAVSASGSFIQTFRSSSAKQNGYPADACAFNYSFSFGQLLLPKIYKNYKQINLNAMTELLGQTNTAAGNSFIDIAPSVQAILQSQIRIDLGYRFPVVHSLYRMEDRGFLLRVEYNFFNAF